MSIGNELESMVRAASELPSGVFVMTATHDGARVGARARSVQVCADEPLLISVALRKGHAIEPVVRDSHAFALCWIHEHNKLLMRKFSDEVTPPPDVPSDAFDSLLVEKMTTGSPILRQSIVALDCQVVRHFDLEADHELYIGQVVAARSSAKPD